MLDVILQILSVIGTILLVLVILLVVLLLLVLFFPITYGFEGTKQEDIIVKAKANWLFGVLRVRYSYDISGKLVIKFLWFTLYKATIPEHKTAEEHSVPTQTNNQQTQETVSEEVNNDAEIPEHSAQEVQSGETVTNQDSIENQLQEAAEEENEAKEGESGSFAEKIFKKIEQIKYTIQGLCDRIKKIWENINYYVALLQEDSTKELFRHVCLRVGNILKSIRPRRLKADILFGTGAPDTTGYVYAIYGILSAFLGPKFIVTPDFEQAVLRGELQFSGHITIWILVINGLKLLFDKKLHRFIKKVKAGLPKKDAAKTGAKAQKEEINDRK